jgi:hypothetical protein
MDFNSLQAVSILTKLPNFAKIKLYQRIVLIILRPWGKNLKIQGVFPLLGCRLE